MKLNVEVYKTKSLLRNERWRIRIRSGQNGRVLFVSSEGYTDRAHAEHLAHGLVAGGHTYEVKILG